MRTFNATIYVDGRKVGLTGWQVYRHRHIHFIYNGWGWAYIPKPVNKTVKVAPIPWRKNLWRVL